MPTFHSVSQTGPACLSHPPHFLERQSITLPHTSLARDGGEGASPCQQLSPKLPGSLHALGREIMEPFQAKAREGMLASRRQPTHPDLGPEAPRNSPPNPTFLPSPPVGRPRTPKCCISQIGLLSTQLRQPPLLSAGRLLFDAGLVMLLVLTLSLLNRPSEIGPKGPVFRG